MACTRDHNDFAQSFPGWNYCPECGFPLKRGCWDRLLEPSSDLRPTQSIVDAVQTLYDDPTNGGYTPIYLLYNPRSKKWQAAIAENPREYTPDFEGNGLLEVVLQVLLWYRSKNTSAVDAKRLAKLILSTTQ